MALYGLAVFNLHYWGFGIPFILAGAWYLVRAYRLQRDLKEATGDVPGTRPGPVGAWSDRRRATRPNKRYTPPIRPAEAAAERKRRSGTRRERANPRAPTCAVAGHEGGQGEERARPGGPSGG